MCVIDVVDSLGAVVCSFEAERARRFDEAVVVEADGRGVGRVHRGSDRFESLFRTEGGRWFSRWFCCDQGWEGTATVVAPEYVRQWLCCNGLRSVAAVGVSA